MQFAHEDRQDRTYVIEKTSVIASTSEASDDTLGDLGRISEVRVARASEPRARAGSAVDGAFQPIVRLFSDDVLVHRVEGLASRYDTVKLPLLALAFAYDDVVVRASDPIDGARDLDELAEPSELAGRVARDLAGECRARRLLESFGAVELECLDDYAASPGIDADYVVRCDGNVHEFCAFTAEVVPKLRALGWRVEVAADHHFRTIDAAPRWYAALEVDEDDDGEDGDWFSLEHGVDHEGRRVNLLPALVDLLERMSDGQGLHELVKRMPKMLAVPIDADGGLYLALPAASMRTLLRVLAELYDGRKQTGAFRVPKSKVAALAELDVVFRGAAMSLEWTGGEALRARAAKLSSPPPAAEAPPLLRAELRPYQKDGLAWLQHLRALGVGGILADDMGLGKTLQTIAHVAMEKAEGRLQKPVLIVAPTSVIPNWQREFARFAPHVRVVPLHGPQRHERFAEAARADVVVTSYPLVCRDEESFAELEFHLVILDEAQTIKNLRSRVHQAIREVRADHRLCLTGTPVENHLGELWALMDFLNPGLLGDEVSFGRFYRVPIEKGRNEERLGALRELLAPYILRRTKAEVAKELPPKTELSKPVELRGKQRELYESIRVAAHAEVRTLIRKKGLAASTIPILGALTKLRQVCCDPRLVGSEFGGGAGASAGESAKYEAFEELLHTLRSQGRRVLVFSQFTTMLKIIARGLDRRRIDYALLTGDTQDRAAQVDAFQGGEADVFLISLRAGGTGLTLTRADAVIHYDPWWNPAVQAQATDRAYRIGQTCPVFVYNLYVAGSVEERMLRLQKRKRSVADAILGAAAPSAALSEDDVEILFAPLGA
jgi:non-specific serine/threonine protein kinase